MTGYGKLYINGKFITRVYNNIIFLKSIPIGQNEIKVIISSNMDHDIAMNKKLSVVPKVMSFTSDIHKELYSNESRYSSVP